MSDTIWLRKARRTQRTNHFMRWFYLTNIAFNVVLSYVGRVPWISRLAALILLVALVVNELMIQKLDQAMREVSMSMEPDPEVPETEEEGTEEDDKQPDE
jgi:membrane protein YdbS with pleckstrin-like domain